MNMGEETELERRMMSMDMDRQMMMIGRKLNMDMDRQITMMRRRMNADMDRQMMMMRRKMNLNTIPLGRNLNRGRPPIVGRDLNSNLNPLGFSFYPSDEELLTLYLKNKLLNKPLPPDVDAIKSLDIYMCSPQDLSATPGSSEKIYGSKSKTPLGYKKTLVFYQGKLHQANPTKTSWIMEEYKIDLNIIQSKSDDPIWTGWVVCKVYNKEKDPRKIEVDIEAYSLLKSKAHPIFPSC
ncbi:hypothetical protein CISIN_1g042311mg [Citrus sinensis]|uniref:NAC domain-containing protein n=1 Tax=Citrus sinensis TaxID=2711 RepID=A0A067DI75_CITSI|nr:hypothetical protein CISIN_1g042311mg [Citrus sinensis]